MDGWPIVAGVIIDIEGFFKAEVLVAKVAAFEQKELGGFADTGVDGLQAHGLAFVGKGGVHDFVEAYGTMDEGNATALAQGVGGEAEDVIEGAGVFVTGEGGFAVRIGSAVADLEEGWVTGDEVVASLMGDVAIAQVVDTEVEMVGADAVAIATSEGILHEL